MLSEHIICSRFWLVAKNPYRFLAIFEEVGQKLQQRVLRLIRKTLVCLLKWFPLAVMSHPDSTDLRPLKIKIRTLSLSSQLRFPRQSLMMTDYTFSCAKFERLSNDGKGFLSPAGLGKRILENITNITLYLLYRKKYRK